MPDCVTAGTEWMDFRLLSVCSLFLSLLFPDDRLVINSSAGYSSILLRLELFMNEKFMYKHSLLFHFSPMGSNCFGYFCTVLFLCEIITHCPVFLSSRSAAWSGLAHTSWITFGKERVKFKVEFIPSMPKSQPQKSGEIFSLVLSSLTSGDARCVITWSESLVTFHWDHSTSVWSKSFSVYLSWLTDE